MFKKILVISSVLLIMLVVSLVLTGQIKAFLFRTSSWLIVLSLILGFLTGSVKALIRKYSASTKKGPDSLRHNLDSYLEHWGTTLFLIVLTVSGYIYYFNFTLFSKNLHFVSLFLALFFGCYFLADFLISHKFIYLLPSFTDIFRGTIGKYFFGLSWKDEGKYLSSQKSAFLAFFTIGFGIILTGSVKMAALVWPVSYQLVRVATTAHDILGILFIVELVVHVAFAVAVRGHRKLLASWFTGEISKK
jgi:cytochrome b subunit of formate dehydrogenase